MKALPVLALAIALSACVSAQQVAANKAQIDEAQSAAARVLVTGTDGIPGRKITVLGPVEFFDKWDRLLGRLERPSSCSVEIARAAIAQYGKVDAVVAYRPGESGCDDAGWCSVTCDGTAARYADISQTAVK